MLLLTLRNGDFLFNLLFMAFVDIFLELRLALESFVVIFRIEVVAVVFGRMICVGHCISTLESWTYRSVAVALHAYHESQD